MQQENNELKVKLRDIEILHDRQEREAIEIINQQNAKIRSLEYTNSELQRELFDLKERLNRAGQSEQEITTIRRDYERLVADYQNQDALVRQLQNRIYELENLLQNKDRDLNEHSHRVHTLHEENQIIRRTTEDAGRNIDVLRREN